MRLMHAAFALGLAVALIALASIAVALGGTRSDPELKALARAARPGDSPPLSAERPLELRFGKVLASRRIATAAGVRRVAVYLLSFKKEQLCLLIRINAAATGAACSRTFFAQRRIVASVGERMLWGLAANEVTRVAFVDANGDTHRVRLTRDGGFIYQCRVDRCLRFIRAVDAYDRHGSRITRIRL